MIPKVIHYCWFSGDPYPDLVKRCMRSWKRFLPDYELRLWDGNSFDWDSVPFVKEAMEAKKYAFAADYIRLYALYTEGGVYLDSDVEVLDTFDTFMDNNLFIGTEPYIKEDTIFYDLESAIMGSQKGHPFLKETLNYYDTLHFNGKDQETICHIMARLAEPYGYTYENRSYHLTNDVTIYPLDHVNDKYSFYNKTAIHWCQGSWLDYPERSRLYYFCKKNGYMKFYHWLERINPKNKR